MLSPTGPQQHDAFGQKVDNVDALSRRRPWMVRLIWLLALVIATGAVVLLLKPDTSTQAVAQRFGKRSGLPTAMPVSVAAVTTGDIPISLQALGTVTPLATVTARTRVAGQLTHVAFSEGQQVNKGDLLVQVDPRPYELALDQAKSQLMRDQAELANAEMDLSRYQSLVKQNAIPRQQLDTQNATVRQLQATARASETAVRTAELNLEYTSTVAPISGRAGLRQIDEGNYVQTGDANGLVTITQMKPISVLFSVPEDQLPVINQRLSAGEMLPVALYDRNRVHKLAEGRLATLDNQIDVNTGTIRLRAVFDNADETLFPNQFVNVELLVDTMRDAVVIPVSARLTGAPGTFAWLIDKDAKTVSIRPIKTGVSSADTVAVVGGLKPGDLVVTDGSDRLREGMQVVLPAEYSADSSATARAPGEQTSEQRPRRRGADGAGNRPSPPSRGSL
ncbi:MdtA/MuxA family multidrug efflux RND transporter periplasmic adaptor subunit [Pseudochelatococcus sp. G4_1912]|uniref:MdtA/MuxA family multidrug efflux RND transporter periplasmic adaptor subunit n=1 Tax=Pseudochelatococcus sp. G4_1912 TaxID=3114288 RepID=UPI0039C6636E